MSTAACSWSPCWPCRDEGAPSYDHENAAALAELGVPAFACTPDMFPELMAAAIDKRDLGQWAAANGPSRDAPP